MGISSNFPHLLAREKAKMEGGEEQGKPKWEQRMNAMTHILTSPTNSPRLHSQLLIATQIPCYLNWEYPPILCNQSKSSFPSLHWRWAFSVYLKRVFNRCPPKSSWRSKCPYHQPPPLVLAKGLEEARWDEEYRRELFRKRFSRKPLVNKLNPLIPILLPNIIVLSVLLWDIPLPDRY